MWSASVLAVVPPEAVTRAVPAQGVNVTTPEPVHAPVPSNRTGKVAGIVRLVWTFTGNGTSSVPGVVPCAVTSAATWV